MSVIGADPVVVPVNTAWAVKPPSPMRKPPALLRLPLKMARPFASSNIATPEMLPVRLVAPFSVVLVPPPCSRTGLLRVMLPLRVCELVALLNGVIVGMKLKVRGVPAAVSEPLSTMMSRPMTAFAPAAEMLRVGRDPTRSASFSPMPKMIAPWPGSVWLVLKLSVPRPRSASEPAKVLVAIVVVPMLSAVIVPDRPERSPLSVSVESALIRPALPVMALLTMVVPDAPKKTPGCAPKAIVPPLKVPVPEVLRIIPEPMPSVCPAAMVVVWVPVRLSALMFTELATLAAAVRATLLPALPKSAAYAV
jgi:hypothetical protein